MENGDSIYIDAVTRELSMGVDEATLAARKAKWTPPAPKHKRGVLYRYARVSD